MTLFIGDETEAPYLHDQRCKDRILCVWCNSDNTIESDFRIIPEYDDKAWVCLTCKHLFQKTEEIQWVKEE